jgi:integrase
VFCREDGRPIHPHLFSRWFDRHVRAAGLPRVRFHDLRHGHATLALEAGIHPKIVSERLGHASIAITLDTYSHVMAGVREEAAEKVAALVFR